VIPLLYASCAQRQHEPNPSSVTEITRVVRIAAVAGQPGAVPDAGDNSKLTVSSGGPEDLPQGPDGFDVSERGLFLITDPLRQRLALFNSDGAYQSEWPIGFPADSVTALPDGSVVIRNAHSGALSWFDSEGRPLGEGRIPEPPNARLVGTNSGVVDRPGAPLEIRFEKLGLTLLSLQGLGSDATGDTYVALEAATAGNSIDVNKSVRRYSRSSQLVAETGNLPLDYYVRPVNELRVHKGIVYQLMTTESEVRIHVWNLNRGR
jgi:hypothetical protein